MKRLRGIVLALFLAGQGCLSSQEDTGKPEERVIRTPDDLAARIEARYNALDTSLKGKKPSEICHRI